MKKDGFFNSTSSNAVLHIRDFSRRTVFAGDLEGSFKKQSTFRTEADKPLVPDDGFEPF